MVVALEYFQPPCSACKKDIKIQALEFLIEVMWVHHKTKQPLLGHYFEWQKHVRTWEWEN